MFVLCNVQLYMCDNNEYTEIDMDNWKDYTKLLLMTMHMVQNRTT